MSRMPAFCTVGSVAALLTMLSPIASMSTQGQTAQPHAGCGSPASRIASIAAITDHHRRITGDGDAARGHAVRQQEAIAGECVIDSGRERMLRRKSVVDRQRPRPRRAAHLGHDMTMAVERADDIAAAVQIQHGLAAISVRRRRPFRSHAVGDDRFHRDID